MNSEKFQNKYRTSSIRLAKWDYKSKGLYFVTICTNHMKCYFGTIKNGRVKHSKIGAIAIDEWIKTIEIRSDMNLHMGEFIIMPNHFHAIIGIGDNIFNSTNAMLRVSESNAMHRVANKFGPQSKNLGSIIRGFKSAVTTNARKLNIPFEWQPRFYEHIIRDDASYNRISNYIINNPLKWNNDKFHLKSNANL